MFKLVSTTLALCALSAGAALAQTQDAAARAVSEEGASIPEERASEELLLCGSLDV